MSRIRIAKEEDLETLMMLAKEFHIAFREGSLPRWEESVQDWGQWLSSCITLRDRVCLIAEEDGEPAGFLTAILLPAWYNLSFLTATETAVWVRRKFRRSGLASELIDVLIRWGKIGGATRITAGSKQQLGSKGVKAMLEKKGFGLDEKLYTREV